MKILVFDHNDHNNDVLIGSATLSLHTMLKRVGEEGVNTFSVEIKDEGKATKKIGTVTGRVTVTVMLLDQSGR